MHKVKLFKPGGILPFFIGPKSDHCLSFQTKTKTGQECKSSTSNRTIFFIFGGGRGVAELDKIVRRSLPRHSPPQTFTTTDVHHPLCEIRRSPPQTFTTSDVHHPQCKIRRTPPQTFTTSDIHHPIHSSKVHLLFDLPKHTAMNTVYKLNCK